MVGPTYEHARDLESDELAQERSDHLLLLRCKPVERAADIPPVRDASHPAGQHRQPQGVPGDVEPNPSRQMRFDASQETQLTAAFGEVDEDTHGADHGFALISHQADGSAQPYALMAPAGTNVDDFHESDVDARVRFREG